MPKSEGLVKGGLFRKRTAKWQTNNYFRLLLFFIVFVAVIYLIVRNVSTFGNVLLVVIGFGGVVLVHEFGHFIVAKLSGIKVEAFSIGFPPTLCGILRTEKGYRIRILPDLFKKEDDKSDDGTMSFTIGRKRKAGETEYRIGLIPFGGFVKMLGQEDVGSAEASEDPRSYANKPISVRMGVITAGVVFNAVSAVVVFMMVFLIGIKLPPAVVGAVLPDSPAARAGLKAGDEVIEIAGKSDNLDFSDIKIAAALSDKGEEIAIKLRHEDGSIENVKLVAEQLLGERLRSFGVIEPVSLTIADVSDANALFEMIGLLPGDRIKVVNGRDVQTHWQLQRIIKEAFVATATVLAERTDKSGRTELIESQIQVDLSHADAYEIESESDLSHIYSMVPRLKVTAVLDEGVDGDSELSLQIGDVIVAIGDVENPTYQQMRAVTTEYEKKELPIKVLRKGAGGIDRTVTVTVVPKRTPRSDRVLIGVTVALDAEHPVVAKTISVEDGPEKLAIPRGAWITAVDGARVSNFYDVIREIRRHAGQRVTIDWRINEEIAGDVVLDIGKTEDFITVKPIFAVPFADLKRLYKASGPIDAVAMGYKKTVMFIAQTYVTLKLLVGGLVSARDLTGPVGIITLSYRIVARQPMVYYAYFLGLISACIAVFNFLPLPPLDGGLIVLLAIEKVKGSPLSERTQGIIAYASWILIGALIIYVTFNDIVNLFR